MRVKEDLIPVVEAAYNVEGNIDAWLYGIAEAARPAFDAGWGVFAFTYDASADAWIQLTGVAAANPSELVLSRALNTPPMPPSEISTVVQLYRTRPVLTLRDACRALPAEWSYYAELLDQLGCQDILGINGVEPSAQGVCFAAPSAKGAKMPAKVIFQRSRLAAHLAAGYRIRRQLAAWSGHPLEQSPGTEAIFEPDGKLQHAVGPATERTSREHLRDSVLAVERARTARVRQRDAADALEIWQGLIDGRWSLLEQFDRDGRRYLIAHRNDPLTPDPRGLTERERQVLAYALLGHANKLIGYELGLTASAVGHCLQRVCRKLGVESRVELVRRFAHLVPLRRASDSSTD